MNKPEILFLKQETVIEAGALDMKKILETTEDTFRMIGENKIINPDKVFLGMPNSENWSSYCMSMPSYIGGEYDVVGFKWASESIFNSTQKGMPYGVDIIVLTEPKTVYPKAIMDGTLITAMRTSAAAGICAKYSARKNTKKACLVGAGVIGRTMIMAITEVLKSLEEIRIVDLDINKTNILVDEFKDKYNIKAYLNLEKALKDADLVVTQTTSRSCFIEKEWLKKNATLIQMETNSFSEETILSADNIILDNWSQMSKNKGSINNLYGKNKINRESIVEIQELVTNKKEGRKSEDELIYCGTYGTGAVDIAVAEVLYRKAVESGIGEKLSLWDNPLWV